MTDPLERVAEKVKLRLGEIDDEAGRLRRALAALEGDRRAAPAKRSKPATRRSGRAARGERARQFLEAAAARPDSTVAELGKSIGVSTSQAAGLAGRLAKEKRIKRSGRKIRVVGTVKS